MSWFFLHDWSQASTRLPHNLDDNYNITSSHVQPPYSHLLPIFFVRGEHCREVVPIQGFQSFMDECLCPLTPIMKDLMKAQEHV